MISKEQLDIEEDYEKYIDSNVEKGILHPRLIRWWNESKANDALVDSGSIAKERYKICKSCEEFKNSIKLCEVCKCFMPLKTQLFKSKCPKGKWV
jgi:hypothetical protein